MLFLDAQHRLLVVKDLFRGTLTQTSVYPREVLREALAQGADLTTLTPPLHPGQHRRYPPVRPGDETDTLKEVVTLK